MRVVYGIWSLHHRKVVIGSSVNHVQRWGVHRRALSRNEHWNHQLQNIYNKHGSRNLRYTILELVHDDVDTFKREQWWITKLWPTGRLLNESHKVLRFPSFHELPKHKQERVRRLVSKARIRWFKRASPEAREHFTMSYYRKHGRGWWFGKKRPGFAKKMMGRRHSHATKRKMRAAAKRWWAKNPGVSRKQSPESIAKIRAARLLWWKKNPGWSHPHKPATIRKIREAARRRAQLGISA